MDLDDPLKPDLVHDLTGPVRVMADALDGLAVGLCLFDEQDRCLLWNRTFLRFFPEHEGHVHVGESYRDNLRRFYGVRLASDERGQLDRFVAEGLQRHRAQHRPFAFEHRGRCLWVSSLPMPGIGRVRMWREEGGVQLSGSAGTSGIAGLDSQALLDHMPDGVMITSPDQRIVWVNEPFLAMYGLRERQAAIGSTFEQVFRAAWSATAREGERAMFDEGVAILGENLHFTGAPFELPLPDARWSRVIGERSAGGTCFFAHVDITLLKRQQQQLLMANWRTWESDTLLRQKSTMLEAALERMEQGIIMVNPQGVVEVCNKRVVELLDLPPELMASRPAFREVQAIQLAQRVARGMPAGLAAQPQAIPFDQPYRYERQQPDGRVIEVYSVPMDGGGAVLTYTDITDRRRSEERIRYLARHDGLTSLVNREVFLEHMAGAALAASHGGEGFAVHYIDIDNFKPINDRYGHAAGDKVLVTAARRMREVIGPGDVLARIGGDEFALLQHGTNAPSAARSLAERMLLALGLPMEVDTQTLSVKASVGIALSTGVGDDPDELIRRADSAMYLAKARGAGGVCLFGAVGGWAGEGTDSSPM